MQYLLSSRCFVLPSASKSSNKSVVKKSQPSAKNQTSVQESASFSSLELTILKNLGEAHSLGVSLDKEQLCKLSGYNHPSTKTYHKAFKGCKDKGMLVVVTKNVVDLTPAGSSFLSSRGELPSTPINNDDAMTQIKVFLQKVGLHKTGFEVLDVLVERHMAKKDGLTKNDLAEAVDRAPTTKSFAYSLSSLTSFGFLEKPSGKYSVTTLYVPFPVTGN